MKYIGNEHRITVELTVSELELIEDALDRVLFYGFKDLVKTEAAEKLLEEVGDTLSKAKRK